MEKLKLVFEVLKGGSDRVKALRLLNGGVVIVDGESLDEDITLSLFFDGTTVSLPLLRSGCRFDGFEEVRARNQVNLVAKLVVQIPDFLKNGFDFFDLHFSHFMTKKRKKREKEQKKYFLFWEIPTLIVD